MRSSDSGGEPPSSDPDAPDDQVTAAGVAPATHVTSRSETAVGALERAALQRARSDLLGRPYEPVRLGRFVLLERLGAGGMGVVYGGYDDTLDRKIAIKLITPERASNDQARRRLFREAQAMAKLNHPNVVQVFEAGEDGDRLFVAMEFVEGKTLRAWLRERPDRSWPEIVALFLEIGAGLAAAHAAGIVHRDFKPDNVLVGKDGRPKVADFGVAALDVAASSVENETSEAVRTSPNDSLTRTGEVMGTPAYMSPEHCRGRQTDARSDQFSFCVVLYEALYAERPFGGDTSAELMRNIADHRLRPVTSGVTIPSWLRAAVLRGLAPRPEDRYATMDDLLRVLAFDPRRRARRIGAAIAVPLAMVGAVAALSAGESEPQPCSDGSSRLVGIWDPERKAEIHLALASVDTPYAGDTAARTEALLDAYAGTWVDGYRDACQATRIRRDQSEHVMDLRMACLMRAKTELAAVTKQLANPDPLTVERAIRMAISLPRLDRCADLDAVRAQVPPPEDPEVASEVEDVRAQRAEALVLRVAGRAQEAHERLESLQERVETLDYEPIRLEVDVALAAVLLTLGRFDEAEPLLEHALGRALSEGLVPIAADAASTLTLLVGERLGRYEEARWLGQVALGLTSRLGDDVVLARVHTNLGGILLGQGRLTEAESELRRALELLEGELDPDDPGIATGLENLSMVLSKQYAYEEAETLQRQVHAIRLAALGPEHPDLASSHANLGTTLYRRGKLAESEAEHRQALALFEAAYGPDHPDVGISWGNLGITLDRRGRHQEAEAAYRRALGVFETAFGPDHAHVASAHNNLGASFQDQERLEEAEAEFRAALAIYVGALGSEHPHVARAHTNIGLVLEAQNRIDEGIRAHRAAFASAQGTLPISHPEVAIARMYLGRALVSARVHDEARTHLEQALEVLETSEAPPDHLARAAFALAKVLVEHRDETTRAISMAEKARAIWSADEEREPPSKDLVEVNEWLARHRMP